VNIVFDAIIDSFNETKVGIGADFLNTSLASLLKENLVKLYHENQMIPAGTGNYDLVSHDLKVRSDKIHWLDRKHNNESENDFFDLMDEFVIYLNSTCYTGITGYEFHYALYETGSFYKKHLDQFRSDSSRVFSMIMYLNVDWEQKDGGALCIHHANHLQHILPNNGKSVFFRSNELVHEVLTTNKPRMSITGWLKRDVASIR
jgi:SM-20-related protein